MQSLRSYSILSSVQTFKASRSVNAPPHILFGVVADVDKYQQFLPYVSDSFISKRDPNGLAAEAGLRVSWRSYTETFTCSLLCAKDEHVVAELTNCPMFDLLHTEWRFTPLPNRFTKDVSTRVDFDLRYKFANPLYNTVLSLFQKQLSDIMIKEFEKRALHLKLASKVAGRRQYNL